MKLIKTADVRNVLDQLGREEITYNKMVELLNEKANERLKAINYSQCCTELNHDDLAVGEQVRITQTKLVEINCFREDGDIDVEDTTSVFTVGIDEIQKVV